jgi:polyhydroxyalkanoate synthesis regulator phasin
MAEAKNESSEEHRSVLNPLDAMVITRERLQDSLDDAVRRGRMTRDDASDLLAEIVRRAISAPAERVMREVRRVTGEDEFPITDYDDLTAAQVVTRLTDLEAPELRRVRDYERRNANRKTVLSAVEQKLN